MFGPSVCVFTNVAESTGTELDVVFALLVGRLSSGAEDFADVAIVSSTSDAPKPKEVLLPLGVCEVAKLERAPDLDEDFVPLEAYKMTEVDDSAAVLDLFAAIAEPFLDFALELKEVEELWVSAF